MASTRFLPVWQCAAVGAGGAIVGLLPWLVTGMRLPLQNLWGTSTMPDAMPLALLPFSQYAIVLIIGLVVTGAAVTGVVARALRSRLPKGGLLGMFVGMLMVQLTALVQTVVVVESGLLQGSQATLYLVALVGVTVVSVAVGIGAFFLIGVAPRAGAVLGLSIGAMAVSPWLSGFLNPMGAFPSDGMLVVLSGVRWVPPVLVGAAIAWGGIGSVGRVFAALGGLGLVWIVPALTTAISSAAGTRVLADHPDQMLAYGLQVFAMASTMPELIWPPILVATVVAAVGLIARSSVSRSRRTSGVTPGARDAAAISAE